MLRRYLLNSTMLRAPDGGGGGGDDEAALAAAKAAADKAAADKAAADKAAAEAAAAKKPTDEEAKLLRELMGHKQKAAEAAAAVAAMEAKLKAFEGIDPAAVRDLLAAKAAADAVAAKAEEDRLKAAGDFDALRARMAGEHDRVIAAKEEEITGIKGVLAGLQKTIQDLTIGTSFASSTFLKEDTLLPPSKARLAYETYFEIKDGVVHAYDKPAGSSDRTPLVDARGKPLPFDEAMKAIIDADPDRDQLLRSKSKPGSGQGPAGGVKTPDPGAGGGETYGISRIADVLRAKNRK